MKLNRRNTIIGLGAIVAGGGAALGTGAFTSVEAERTVSVETAGDADAFLGLTAARDDQFVSEEEDGVITITLGEENGTGVNQDATSTFEDIVEITNNGTQEIELIQFTVDEEEEVLTVIPDEFDDNFSDEGSRDSVLEIGESVTFGIEVDLIDEGDLSSDYSASITIEAYTDSADAE